MEKCNFNLVNNCQNILIALSGGADSVFLLKKTLEKFDKGFIFCVHINHNLRVTSVRDEKFCRELCEKYNIKLFVVSVDVKQLALKNKISIETAARTLRYNAFEKIISENNIKYLLTAHNLDDNIETFFMRIFRGTGLDGLECIPELTDKGTYKIIRPIINLKKQQIVNFLKNNNISFVEDESNFETEYFRNKIRLELIPIITNKLNAEIYSHIPKLIDLIKHNNDFVNNEAKKYISEKLYCFLEKEKIWLISIREFLKVPENLRYIILRKIFAEVLNRNKIYGVELKHIEYLNDFILNVQSGKQINLPFGLIAIKNFENIFISKNINITQRNESDFYYECNLKDLPQKIKNDKYYIELFLSDKVTRFPVFYEYYLTEDEFLNAKLIVRNLKSSDKIFYNKIHNKVKKFFSEKKIPVYERKKLICFILNDEIVYIPEYYKLFQNHKFKKLKKILNINLL